MQGSAERLTEPQGRTCVNCGSVKPLSEFYRRKQLGILRRECKACSCERVRLNRIAWTPERLTRARQMRHAVKLRKHYGMTVAEYDALAAAQGNACAICGQGPRSEGWELSVDHNHATGRVRGLLCVTCNSAIALLGDTVDGVRKAAEYLERNHEG